MQGIFIRLTCEVVPKICRKRFTEAHFGKTIAYPCLSAFICVKIRYLIKAHEPSVLLRRAAHLA